MGYYKGHLNGGVLTMLSQFVRAGVRVFERTGRQFLGYCIFGLILACGVLVDYQREVRREIEWYKIEISVCVGRFSVCGSKCVCVKV